MTANAHERPRVSCSGAKFALIGFMDSLRIENVDNGLQVVNVCPG